MWYLAKNVVRCDKCGICCRRVSFLFSFLPHFGHFAIADVIISFPYRFGDCFDQRLHKYSFSNQMSVLIGRSSMLGIFWPVKKQTEMFKSIN